ncbi:potassium channel family protein [uncultured Sunxiuqinia sp.]|nr:potassium channel family protein [uncultured Sunxiuqinia sp.]
MFKTIILFLKEKTYRNLVISTLVTLFNGTFVYHFVEGWRWVDAFYFSVITLTTVGYGDFSPQTDFGKIFTTIYILTGIGIMLGFVNAIYATEEKHRRKFGATK